MNNPVFTIHFRKMYDKHLYRANVEITYQTENVIRFKITAGSKEILMEKHLYRKSNQWKLTRISFPILEHDKVVAKMILDIQNLIDEHIKNEM